MLTESLFYLWEGDGVCESFFYFYQIFHLEFMLVLQVLLGDEELFVLVEVWDFVGLFEFIFEYLVKNFLGFF